MLRFCEIPLYKADINRGWLWASENKNKSFGSRGVDHDLYFGQTPLFVLSSTTSENQ